MKLFSWLLLPLIVTASALAQPPADPNAPDFEPLYRVTEKKSKIQLVEKFSKIIETETKIVEARDFDSDVISVTPVDVNRLRVQALSPGVTTINVLDENNDLYTLEVFVTGDVRHLQAYLTRLFPSSSVDAVEVQESVVLRGWVTQPEHITEMMEIAEQFYPKVLNQMKVGGVQQVLLKVKVMEVQRTKVRSMGFNFFFSGQESFLTSTPGALTPVASIGNPGVGLSGFADPTVAFGVINSGDIFNGFLEALKEEGLLKIKAEPSLVTTNGRPARLLNGGEFPILVPQGLGTATIEWREFGVNMEAVPIILGNGRLRLELQPEVSERDFANAVEVNGLQVPGLTTRRVNTQVEMKFGQTLMIAGLISRRDTGSTSKLPWLGEFPGVGALFSRKRYEEAETELVVMVTPEYVSPLEANDPIPMGPGETTTKPTDRELFLDGMLEIPKYGDPAKGAPLPPMYYQQPQPVPMSPYMIPPSQPYDSGPLELPPTTEDVRLPPAPAFESESPEIPAQSRSESSRTEAAPFPTNDFWAQGMETVEYREPSGYSDGDFKKTNYNDYEAPAETTRSRNPWTPTRQSTKR
ncbi:MAG: pilus assembly protein N-terminal domain-containing protein [Planctomycetaceae bacterium]|nr:pilus assembly protein N-terminal domain-containing protein [Planctomycetaceae bacterium]